MGVRYGIQTMGLLVLESSADHSVLTCVVRGACLMAVEQLFCSC